jgi:hypothetical protein
MRIKNSRNFVRTHNSGGKVTTDIRGSNNFVSNTVQSQGGFIKTTTIVNGRVIDGKPSIIQRFFSWIYRKRMDT